MRPRPWGLFALLCGVGFVAGLIATAYVPIAGGRGINYLILGGSGVATYACLDRARRRDAS